MLTPNRSEGHTIMTSNRKWVARDRLLPDDPTVEELRSVLDSRPYGGKGHTKEIEELSGAVVIYTDGAYSMRDHCGGWAWARSDGVHASGGVRNSTSQRMELTAALCALQYHQGHDKVVVVSDSAYLVNCFRQAWHVKWSQRGWVGSTGKDVANRDLWEGLIPLMAQPGRSLYKVRGHSGHEMNELVDRLAVEARLSVLTKGPTPVPPDPWASWG
jgi:ribonuclease HI